MIDQILNGSAEWVEIRGAWRVVVSNDFAIGIYEVVACDEWVIPLAEMVFLGLNVSEFCGDDWSVREVKRIEIDHDLDA